jgi:hypothetical protein
LISSFANLDARSCHPRWFLRSIKLCFTAFDQTSTRSNGVTHRATKSNNPHTKYGDHMPNWQPNWENVTYDFAAADDAIADCRACIGFMEQREVVLGPPRRKATEQWRGRYREEFDRETLHLEGLANQVIHELHDSIRAISNETDAARNEQHRRVLERLRWEDESRREHFEAEQRASAGTALVVNPTPTTVTPTTSTPTSSPSAPSHAPLPVGAPR